MAKVAFIGLGVMGYPMAGYLSQQGHQVTVYNRTTAKAEQWVAQYGGQLAKTPKQAAQDKEFVFTCVGNDDDLRQVVLGEQGAAQGMNQGAILVDHTTASADVAREIAATLKAAGIEFMDAPISGGQAGAENGVLTVMMGGNEATFDQVKQIGRAHV